MYFNEIVALLALGTVIIANYTDLTERIIPNKLTFSMIIAGIALYLGYGAYRFNLYFALQGGIGALVAFAIGYGMWYIGGWAGGDVKLYTALAALLGGYTAPNVFTGHITSFVNPPYPFFLTILFNGIICLAPVLIIYVVVKSIKTEGVGEKVLEPFRESYKEILIAPFVIIGGSALALKLVSLGELADWSRFVISLVSIFILYRLPLKIKAPAAIGLTGIGMYFYGISAAKYLAFSFIFILGIRFAITSVKVVNREVLQEEIPISELDEGMIPGEDIYVKDGEAERYEGPGFLERAKNMIGESSGNESRQEWDKVLADSSIAAGVTEEQAEELKKHVEKGDIEDSIRIKQGLPFAPSFGLGVPIAIFLGDIYWLIIERISGI